MASLSEASAFSAERLVTCALPYVLFLDVVSGVALGVVVMDLCLDRVPRRFLRHVGFLIRVISYYITTNPSPCESSALDIPLEFAT